MKNSEPQNSQHYMAIEGDRYRCSIGRSGVVANKKEGDGATPLGTFGIKQLYYRPDRIDRSQLETDIELVIPLTPNDGWCDDINSPEYNKFVTLPFAGSYEKLWREEDNLYDIIGVLDFNGDPVIKGKGSAIFLHIAREDYSPTAGCIALSQKDLLSFLAQFSRNDKIETNLFGNCEVVKGPSLEFRR